MKKTLKYLSILAVSGSLLLGTLNVNAKDTCDAGDVEHTDYVMFLDAREATDLINEIEAAHSKNNGKYTQLNGADKFNNIKGKKIIEHGDVNITMGNKATVAGDADITWSILEYWQRYLKMGRGEDRNHVYNDPNGTETYLGHDKWIRYEAEFTNPEERDPDISLGEERKNILDFLESNLKTMTVNSDFIRNGNVIPGSSVTPPEAISTAANSFLRWKVMRVFDYDTDRVSGVDFSGTGKKTIYAPAAYYVTYCVADSSNNKTIKYDGNGNGDTVTKVPEKNTFTDKCTKISDQKPERAGYDFLGWSASNTATQPNSKYAPGTDYCEGNITLYAIWKKKETNSNGTYTVTYDANGGKNAPASQTEKIGNCTTISSNKPTLAGNKFLGWSSVKDAKEPETKYAAGASYCENANITLYAVWQPVTGISAHMIAFGIVAIAAGAALVVAKKKDLFRQI